MNNNYVVYHLHSDLSLLDSTTKYEDYVKKAVQLGQVALASTEHGQETYIIGQKKNVYVKDMELSISMAVKYI